MSATCSRRAFLTTGATITGGALLGGAGACAPESSVAPLSASPNPAAASVGAAGDPSGPRVLRSRGGVLAATIGIDTNPAVVAGRPRLAPLTYDGTFPGPTLWVGPGDSLDLTFRNRIAIEASGAHPGYGRPPRPEASVTNVHYHGLHVPPTGTADNMLVHFHLGEAYRYRFPIPADHPAGLFWYHPHVHGLVTEQLGRGACGMLYVASAHTDAVSAAYRRRILVLQQLYLGADLRSVISDDGNRDDPQLALTVVNGEQMPELALRPGERQVWGIANASTSAFYQLRFPDGFAVRVLAYDGLTRTGYPGGSGPTVQLPPGKRVELEVQAPSQRGSWVLGLDAYDQGVDTWPARPIATLGVGGTPAIDPGAVPLDPAGLPSLASATPARRRTIVFDQDDAVPEGEYGRFRMYLRGSAPHAFDPATPEWTDSTLGTVEEWTIENHTAQEHPFHVHVNPFQVMSVTGSYNAAPPPAALTTGYHDTVVVPPHGAAVVRTRFADFAGGPVLMHCHIIDHEDMGMMTSFHIRPAV